ncbi:MAG: AAA family ATPase [Pseudomonadota bacterium]
MKIQSLEIQNYPPIKNLKIENLGDVVIIAGGNGSGKSRLKEAISQTLRGSTHMSLVLGATRDEERNKFNGSHIEVKQGQSNSVLQDYINSRRFGRGEYVGSLVQIDSRRNIETTKYNPVKYAVEDPDNQDTPSTFYYENFSGRWQNFMDYIYKKVASHQGIVADEAAKGELHSKEIIKKHPHPLTKYKEIFSQLLPGKELQDINPTQPKSFQYKNSDDQVLDFERLSSGEQEVVKIIFDIVRKDIKHSVVIVDEPELHLHPTLAFRLVETLKSIGGHTNQFILLTHSADLISTYYSTGDVYFIDSIQTGSNQAHKLSDLNHSHKDLVQAIGDNVGLISVGKKIIFAEGENSSIDRLTYHSISQKILPEAKITPIGSVQNIVLLGSIEEQIRNSIFGVNFYMIRDRDGLSEEQIKDIEKSGRVKCLKRRHLENYFLEPDILFEVAQKFYLTTSNPNLTKDFIATETKRIATESFNYTLLQSVKEYIGLNCHLAIPTVKSPDKKSLDEIKAEIIQSLNQSLDHLSNGLADQKIKDFFDKKSDLLTESLSNGKWQSEFHGKIIFSKLCSEVLKDRQERIKPAYIDTALETGSNVLNDIIDIFEGFKN